MIKQILTGFCLLIVCITVNLPAYAQTQPTPVVQPAKPANPPEPPAASAKQPAANSAVSTPDLDKFAAAIKQMMTINQASEAQIEQEIKAEGLTDQRFREIYTSDRDPKAQLTSPITPPEKQSYDRAVVKIVKIQQDDQTKMEKVITAQGLKLEQFNEIFDIVQKNPDLQQAVKQKLQS